jgi:predicted acylesterase/phospholipase RssA
MKSEEINDKPKILVIGGGGLKGINELGALQYFNSENLLSDIEIFAGTSIGSILCLLLSIGYEPLEIFSEILKIENWIDIGISNILYFFENWGLVKSAEVINIVKKMIKNKFRKIPTMFELFLLTKKHLIITTVKISNPFKLEYIDHISNPNLNCLDAVELSCNIPVIFFRKIYNNSYYLDGGVLDNYPISYIQERFPNENILGICVDSEMNIEGMNDFISYIYNLIMLLLIEAQKPQQKKLNKNCKSIELTSDIPFLKFSISREKKISLFEDGYKQAKEKYGNICLKEFQDW